MKRAGLAAFALVVLVAAVWLAKRGVRTDGGEPTGTTPAPEARESRRPRPVQPAPAPGAVAAHPQARPQIPARPAPPGLEQDLKDPDPRVRRTAIAELAASDHPDPDVLAAASRDPDLGVAIAGTEGLAKLYAAGQLPASALAARITEPGTPERVRVAALNGLGLVPSPDAASLLVDQLAHGDAAARRSAAILLQHQDPGVAVPALIGALGDADAITRDNAHGSLVAFARGRDLGLDAAAWSTWWQQRR